MAAKLEWENEQLKLGPFTVGSLVKQAGMWRAAGTKALGDLLEDRWERVDDARQDVETKVREILQSQGVVLQ